MWWKKGVQKGVTRSGWEQKTKTSNYDRRKKKKWL